MFAGLHSNYLADLNRPYWKSSDILEHNSLYLHQCWWRSELSVFPV